jgi:hypothetical protein
MYTRTYREYVLLLGAKVIYSMVERIRTQRWRACCVKFGDKLELFLLLHTGFQAQERDAAYLT